TAWPGVVTVEHAVDLLERGDELLAPRRVPPIVDLPLAMVVLDADQLVEQLVAPGDQLLPLAGPGYLIARRPRAGPNARERDERRERERDGPRRGAVGRETADDELDRLPRCDLAARRGDEHLVVGRHLALLCNLRRPQRRVADFFDDDGKLLERGGKGLDEVEGAALARHRAGDLHERVAWLERRLDRDRRPLRLGLRRRALHDRRAPT